MRGEYLQILTLKNIDIILFNFGTFKFYKTKNQSYKISHLFHFCSSTLFFSFQDMGVVMMTSYIIGGGDDVIYDFIYSIYNIYIFGTNGTRVNSSL